MLLVAAAARFQEFYQEGERAKLLAEISELRDQVSGCPFLVIFGFLSDHQNKFIKPELAF